MCELMLNTQMIYLAIITCGWAASEMIRTRLGDNGGSAIRPTMMAGNTPRGFLAVLVQTIHKRDSGHSWAKEEKGDLRSGVLPS